MVKSDECSAVGREGSNLPKDTENFFVSSTLFAGRINTCVRFFTFIITRFILILLLLMFKHDGGMILEFGTRSNHSCASFRLSRNLERSLNHFRGNLSSSIRIGQAYSQLRVPQIR